VPDTGTSSTYLLRETFFAAYSRETLMSGGEREKKLLTYARRGRTEEERAAMEIGDSP